MNELEAFYLELLRDFQRLVLSKAKGPACLRPKGFTDDQLHPFAARMAQAHRIAPYAHAEVAW